MSSPKDRQKTDLGQLARWQTLTYFNAMLSADLKGLPVNRTAIEVRPIAEWIVEAPDDRRMIVMMSARRRALNVGNTVIRLAGVSLLAVPMLSLLSVAIHFFGG